MRNMSIYNNFKWQDFKVSIKRCGIRRFLWFLPYFTDSKLDLSLSFETISGNQLEFAYQWTYYHVTTDNIAVPVNSGVDSFLSNPQKKALAKIKIHPLFYLGQHGIEVVITYPIMDNRKSPSETVVSFCTIDRDPITMRIFVVVVVSIVASGITLLLDRGYISAFFNWLLSTLKSVIF